MTRVLEGGPGVAGEVERLHAEVKALRAAAQRPVEVDEVARGLERELEELKGKARALDGRRAALEARRSLLRAEFDAAARGRRGRPLLSAAGLLLGAAAGAVGLVLGWQPFAALLVEQGAGAVTGALLLAAAPAVMFLGARAGRRALR